MRQRKRNLSIDRVPYFSNGRLDIAHYFLFGTQSPFSLNLCVTQIILGRLYTFCDLFRLKYMSLPYKKNYILKMFGLIIILSVSIRVTVQVPRKLQIGNGIF